MHQKRGRHQREIKGFTDHALILGSDTVNISDISRIGIMQGEYSKKFRTPGFKILLAGILLGLGDLITVTAVQHKDYDVHKGVAIVSAGLIATGTLMILIKPSTRIGRKNRLLIVTDESPLYKTR